MSNLTWNQYVFKTQQNCNDKNYNFVITNPVETLPGKTRYAIVKENTVVYTSSEIKEIYNKSETLN